MSERAIGARYRIESVALIHRQTHGDRDDVSAKLRSVLVRANMRVCMNAQLAWILYRAVAWYKSTCVTVFRLACSHIADYNRIKWIYSARERHRAHIIHTIPNAIKTLIFIIFSSTSTPIKFIHHLRKRKNQKKNWASFCVFFSFFCWSGTR